MTASGVDSVSADKAKEIAIDKVRRNADQIWSDAALMLVYSVASEKQRFTTDDLWTRGLPPPREPRALGAVMRAAQANGWIRPTDEHKLSVRATCHRRPIRIWASDLGTKESGF